MILECFNKYKVIVVVLLLSILGLKKAKTQSVSCYELQNTVQTYYDSKDYVSCYGSSWIVSVEYYTIEGIGFAIANIKQHDYDIYGKSYVFCGVPYNNWSYFRSDGAYGSWGKAFHRYIMDYKCSCY